MSLVKLFCDVDGIMSIKTNLKVDFCFNEFLDIAIFFMEEICHDVQKGSGYIPSSISYQKLAVSPAKNDIVYLWPNLWCNNSKAIFFLDGNFFVYDISFISPKNACFLCALCGKVTKIFSLAPKYTVKNSL